MWFSNSSLERLVNQSSYFTTSSFKLAVALLRFSSVNISGLPVETEVEQPSEISFNAGLGRLACSGLPDTFRHWQQQIQQNQPADSKLHHTLGLLTLTNATYFSEPTIDIPLLTSDGLACPRTRPINVTVPLCRIQFSIATGSYEHTVVGGLVDQHDSGSMEPILGEAWFPDDWHSHGSRFLALGNGGLGGCIDYENLSYGSRLHFATIGTNAGHSGDTGLPFYKHPEVFRNYAWRAIHLEAVLGKELVKAYYSYHSGDPSNEDQTSFWSRLIGKKISRDSKTHVPRRSYYLGCSTGGRQGLHEALRFPDTFDGIVVGAPAVDVHRLMGWRAMIGKWLGATKDSSHVRSELDSSYIPIELWDGLIANEILRQCDGLDGKIDGIITEPDACDFRPEALLCEDDDIYSQRKKPGHSRKSKGDCLTLPQVEALRKIYSPYYGEDGEVVFPRYDPGSEANAGAQKLVLSGEVYPYAKDWMRYVIYNDTSYNFSDFGLKDILFSDELDPSGVRTFVGDFSPFQQRGGKIITYHGRRDELIPSGNSKRYYNHISRIMRLSSLDSFYRLFLIPGMNHCIRGPGATYFGQHNAADPSILSLPNGDDSLRNTSAYNVLLAIVDWVENGRVPDTIIGTSENGEERAHCRYPSRSEWNYDVKKWGCVS